MAGINQAGSAAAEPALAKEKGDESALKEHYSFEELTDIIATLRGENGCPWDRKQTHASLLKYLVEESYEFIDAAENGTSDDMADELGDVLLQILLHAQIGKEEGTFTIQDVIDHLAKKMIVRHPHVFSDAVVSSSEEVKQNWEQIKYENSAKKKPAEILQSISKSYSPLLRGQKIIQKLKKMRDIHTFSQESIDKINEIVDNRDRLCDIQDTETAIGAAIFELIVKAEKDKISAEMCLNRYLDKFLLVCEEELANLT